MWLNFKSDNRNGNYAAGGQVGRFPHSSSSGKPPNVSRGISRQSSTRSNRSVKSSSSGNTLLRKLDEHELKTKTLDWQKNQDYKMIRERRKAIRKQIDAKLRVVKRLYIPSVLLIIFGIIFLFGATIRTLSDGTVFWSFREQFKIIGPVVLVLGLVLLLTTIGLESHTTEKLKKAGIQDVKPVIHPDFLIEHTKFNRQTSKDSYGSSYDPHFSELDKQKLLWKNSNTDEEDAFLNSSITSTSSGVFQKGKIDRTVRWARAIAMNPNDKPNTVEDSINSNTADDPVDNARRANTYLRAINNVPCIEITDVDEISCRSVPSSATNNGSMSTKSSAASLQTLDQEMTVYSLKDDTLVYKNGSVLSNETGKLRGITEETISQIEEHG